jgi:ADP-ribose pyrophosphatase YjhB (NUDIX family)
VSDLSRYPHPNVAVDIAVLTVRDERLAVLIQDRQTAPLGPALPGRFLRRGETVAKCVQTALREKVGLDPGRQETRLLRVFDDPERDERAWTISLAHYLVLPLERVQGAGGSLVPVDDVSGLLFDHDAIVREAAQAMRRGYELGPDPDTLLTGPFTLSDLKAVHEAVLGAALQRDTFRRRMEPNLEPYMEHKHQATRVDGGRPARLWASPKQVDILESNPRLRLPRVEPR